MQDLIDREAAVAAVTQWIVEQPDPVDIHGVQNAIRSLPSASPLPGGVSAEDVRMVATAVDHDDSICALPSPCETCNERRAAARRILAVMEGR